MIKTTGMVDELFGLAHAQYGMALEFPLKCGPLWSDMLRVYKRRDENGVLRYDLEEGPEGDTHISVCATDTVASMEKEYGDVMDEVERFILLLREAIRLNERG